MGINTPKHSSNKTHKFLRNTAIIASLLTVMNTTQSCKDNKNAGMPVHADAIDISHEEATETTSEYIQIDNNKVTLNYTFDIAENADWNRKNIKYTLEVNRWEDNKIIAVLNGSSYYGAESDRGATPENENTFWQEFGYDSLKEFNERSPDEIKGYINSVMDNLQSINIYQTTPDDDIKVNEEAQKEIQEKTAKLTGYLKYKMNTRESSVQKQWDEVLLPIRRNDNKFDFTIKENKTGIKLQNNKKENAKTYDITLNGKTTTVALSEDDLTFAEGITKEVEKMLKVWDISQKIEDEAFLWKGLEVKQLLDKN